MQGSRDRWSAFDVVACASIVAIAVAQLWPGLSAGLSPPISWDHGSHFGKAALVAEELLPFLRGWTDRVEAGVPQHTLYTPTGTLWVLFFRLFTPSLEWHQTYAIAFAAFRAVVGLTVYRLARVAGAGPLGGLTAGVLALADWGDHSEGGWFYDVIFGVWPMGLAMCVFFLGLSDLLAYLDDGRRSTGTRAMLLLGVALFSHQASLLALGSIGPALVLVRATERTALQVDVTRMIAVFVPAGLIACWWMLPMFASSAWLDDHGQLYRSAPDLGARMVHGTGILNGGTWTGPLVALGLGTALISRGHRRVLAIGAVIAMLIGTPGWLIELDFVRWLPSLGRIVFPRMMMIAKPLLFALAGCVISDLVVRLAPMVRSTASTWPGRLSLALTAILVAPFSTEVPRRAHEAVIARDVQTTATLPDWHDRRQVWSWLREQPGFFRVLYIDDSTHLPQASGAFSGHPAIVVGIVVGEAFRNTPDTTDPEALRELNVRYVVSAALPGQLQRVTREVVRFGRQGIYELSNWSAPVAIDPSGAASPRVAALERERVVVEPRGARVIRVRRAFAPGWAAYADGASVTIEPERIPGSARLRLMRIAVPEGTQRLELRYVGVVAATWIGLSLTMIGLLMVAAFALWTRAPVAQRHTWTAALDRLAGKVPAPVRAHWHWAALSTPFLLVLALMARGASGHHFAYDLDNAAVSVRRAGVEEPCSWRTPEGGWQCPGAPEVVVRRTAMVVDGWFHGCMTAHPPHSGDLVIRWPEAPLSGSLRVGAGISDETFAGGHGTPLDVRVLIDGQEQEVLSVPNGREWVERAIETPSGTRPLEIIVHAPEPYRRDLCIDVVAR